jgi:hypothetical protein
MEETFRLFIDISTPLSIDPEQTPGFRPGKVEGLISS